MSQIAFVGAGPTTLYALNAFLARPVRGACLTIFEAEADLGVGSPYRPGWNDAALLSNIASAEIPPLTETLLGWLQSRSPSELDAMNVDIAAMDDRAFVPRVVLGRYFQTQFDRLVERARALGVAVEVCTGRRVVDAVNRPDGVELTVVAAPHGETTTALFDHVVLATGHQWPSRQEARPGYFLSPWPATTLAALPPVGVGLRGSSLTAVDAAVILAGSHGAFIETGDGLVYEPAAGTEDFRITMMSRKGLLPEADFYFPLPHAPLQVCTPAAIAALVAQGGEPLLDRVFDLFRRELLAVDPAYAASTRLSQATLDAFGDAYFAPRRAVDPFTWAAANLAEARANHAVRRTVPWRDAILRMHEVVAAIVPHPTHAQFERFNRSFKPVFVDVYGAVPRALIERMLALHRAGKLEVIALGDHCRIETQGAEGGAVLIQGDRRRRFPVFIEATGQRPLGALQFPLLSLLEQGIVRDAPSRAESGMSRGIVIDDLYRPVTDALPPDRLFCLSLPFIMGRHPFVQGITSSHEMGEVVGRRLSSVIAARAAPVDTLRAVA